jgi:ribosomal protein S18 acetylase RimI-like enzyme
MSLRPRPALPAGFATEPATGAHAPEVFQMLAAERIAAFGFCPDSLEDVRADLEPTESQAIEHLVRDASGSLVQWWVALTDPGEPIFISWIASHPQLPDSAHDDLAAAGWATLFDWIRDTAPAGAGPIEVRSGCEAGSERGHRRLRAAGFTHQRTFWEMFGPVNEQTRTAAQVPGLTIVASEDSRAIYEVYDQGFKDHWGYVEVSYDDWVKVQPTFSGYDPRLWFLAEVDGAPAAAMTLSRRVEADGAMYVQVLATLERYRRRGIASALLAHAFDIAAREGLTELSLHVDSESTHDAPSVYRRAGLEVRCAYHAHVCNLQR